MIGTRRTVGRLILARPFAAAFGLLFAYAVSAPPAFADDAAGTSREDVLSLQRRLTDAGCYNGAIDGAANAALDAAVKACPDQSPFLRIETEDAYGDDQAASGSMPRAVGSRRHPTIRPSGCGRFQMGNWSVRSACRSGRGMAVWSMLSRFRRTAAASRRAAGTPPMRNSGRTAFRSSTSNSGSIRRVGIFPNLIVHVCLLSRRRSRSDRLGREQRRSGLRLASGKELFADRDYAGDVYGLAFASDGSLIASSYDGQLRRYGPDLRLTAKRGGLAGQRPYGSRDRSCRSALGGRLPCCRGKSRSSTRLLWRRSPRRMLAT